MVLTQTRLDQVTSFCLILLNICLLMLFSGKNWTVSQNLNPYFNGLVSLFSAAAGVNQLNLGNFDTSFREKKTLFKDKKTKSKLFIGNFFLVAIISSKFQVFFKRHIFNVSELPDLSSIILPQQFSRGLHRRPRNRAYTWQPCSVFVINT